MEEDEQSPPPEEPEEEEEQQSKPFASPEQTDDEQAAPETDQAGSEKLKVLLNDPEIKQLMKMSQPDVPMPLPSKTVKKLPTHAAKIAGAAKKSTSSKTRSQKTPGLKGGSVRHRRTGSGSSRVVPTKKVAKRFCDLAAVPRTTARSLDLVNKIISATVNTVMKDACIISQHKKLQTIRPSAIKWACERQLGMKLYSDDMAQSDR